MFQTDSRACSPTMTEGIQSDPIAHIRLDESDIQAISIIVEWTVTAEMTCQISKSVADTIQSQLPNMVKSIVESVLTGLNTKLTELQKKITASVNASPY